MSDDAVATCQTCSAPVQRVFHPIAVHFKGSGFYNTDYGTRKRSREKGESADEAKGGEKSTDTKGTSTKSDSKSSTADSTAPKPKAATSD